MDNAAKPPSPQIDPKENPHLSLQTSKGVDCLDTWSPCTTVPPRPHEDDDDLRWVLKLSQEMQGKGKSPGKSLQA